MSTRDLCASSCGAVWRWEEAGESLANAFASYQRSCVFLESSLIVDHGSSKDLALRIDSALKTLHVKITNELVQSRLALVRMRNKISSRLYSLPKKILSQIFMEVVYVPTAEDRRQSMASHVTRIYTRLHTLLAVCTTWRNVGIAHKPLWSIIPVYEGQSKRLAPRLSIDRSTASRYLNTGIHLVALISSQHGYHIPLVDGKKPKFDTVNIKSKSALAILQFLNNLAKPLGAWPTYQHLSELSIYQVREERRSIKGPKEYPDIFYDCVMYTVQGRGQNPLLELFQYLSLLRVRGATMLWGQIKLSDRLVDLRLQSINFRSDSQLLDFLEALNTAPELRDLKIISVIVFPASTSDSPPPSRSVKCPVPKLQTLLLQDLDYNALRILQGSLAPGPYHTTLCLTEKITFIHEPRKEPIIVDLRDLYKVLKRISVDKLVLCGEWEDKNAWLDHTELRSVLQSLPTVKTLIMTYWKFRKEDLLALERPRSGGKGSKRATVRFPSLTAMYLEDAQMLDVGPFRSIVPSHKLQKMSLSGCVRPTPKNNPDNEIDTDMDTDSDGAGDFKDSIDWHDLDPKDKVVKWLMTQVAQFYLGDVPETESRDYDTSEWKL
ncbi:unnamed protein product [Rhizoctonia solani]|nr:unnamed protein product [Rhizoctonia solani]